MEDYEFSGRMEHAGPCVYIRDIHVIASARRFRGKEIRTFFLWMILQMIYWVGVAPKTIANAYQDIRSDDPSLFLDAWRTRLEGTSGSKNKKGIADHPQQ